MKMPQSPPKISFERLTKYFDKKSFVLLLGQADSSVKAGNEYFHWDELRRRTAPEGLSHEAWWMALKMTRRMAYRQIPLRDKKNNAFQYFIPDSMQELLHKIDSGGGGYTGAPDVVTNPQTRDRYIVNSLIQEAITSSQLEGAATTREVAKEMLRSQRPPRDRHERMILNNFLTMQEIIRIKDKPMSIPVLLEIHHRVTEGTMDRPDTSGRFRDRDEPVMVMDGEGGIYHDPPHTDELPERMQRLCDFANGKTPEQFIPPVIRAIMLHFWLAYDHPFVDGNGRTARALFYWSMLNGGFWLFEYVSISNILLKAPVQYAKSFLYTETDDNDLNYFILHQADTIRQALEALHAYIERKQIEAREAEKQLHALPQFNHRQQAVILHALRHPGQEYTMTSHGLSHQVAYATARSDLMGLGKHGLLTMKKRGKAIIFEPSPDMVQKLESMGKSGLRELK